MSPNYFNCHKKITNVIKLVFELFLKHLPKMHIKQAVFKCEPIRKKMGAHPKWFILRFKKIESEFIQLLYWWPIYYYSSPKSMIQSLFCVSVKIYVTPLICTNSLCSFMTITCASISFELADFWKDILKMELKSYNHNNFCRNWFIYLSTLLCWYSFCKYFGEITMMSCSFITNNSNLIFLFSFHETDCSR